MTSTYSTRHLLAATALVVGVAYYVCSPAGSDDRPASIAESTGTNGAANGAPGVIEPMAVTRVKPAQGSVDNDGKKHGPWTEPETSSGAARFYETGSYVHGKKDGTWSRWTAEAHKCGETTYREGKQHGPWWSETGSVSTRGNFVDGLEQGEFVMSMSNAKNGFKSTTKGVYLAGKKVGVWVDETDGPIARVEKHFEGGVITLSRGWHDNGILSFEQPYVDGKKDGVLRQWHRNGTLEREVNYRRGEQDGLATYWHANGMKEREADYRDGKQVGVYQAWREDGTLCDHWVEKDGRRTIFVRNGAAAPGR